MLHHKKKQISPASTASPHLPASSERALKFQLRAIFIATFFYQLGVAMTIPFIPLFAKELGASIELIGMIVAARSFGSMISNIPGGIILNHVRIRTIMLTALSGASLFAILRSFSPAPVLLLVMSLLFGFCSSLWQLTRLTFLREEISSEAQRGKILANIGGVFRITRVISPFIGGFLIHISGFRLVFLIQGLLILPGFLVILFMLPKGNPPAKLNRHETVFQLTAHFRHHKSDIFIGFLGMLGLTLSRASRDMLVPVWADSLGMTVTAIGTLSSIAAVFEIFMVLPGGWICAHKGSKWAALLTTTLLSTAICLFPIARTVPILIAVVLFSALANGLGSGINMIVGSRLAPLKHPALFFSIWRFFTDGGLAAGPFLVGSIAGLVGLSTAAPAVGFLGICAGLLFLGMKPEPNLKQKIA